MTAPRDGERIKVIRKPDVLGTLIADRSEVDIRADPIGDMPIAAIDCIADINAGTVCHLTRHRFPAPGRGGVSRP